MSLCQNDMHHLKKQTEDVNTPVFLQKPPTNMSPQESSQMLQSAFGASANLQSVDLSTLISSLLADQGRTLCALTNANMTNPSQRNFQYLLQQSGGHNSNNNNSILFDAFKRPECHSDITHMRNQLGNNMVSFQRNSVNPIMLPHPMQHGMMPYMFTPSLAQTNAVTSINSFQSNGSTSPSMRMSNAMPMSEPARSVPNQLPLCLAQPADHNILSEHQQFLRFQIEVFEASEKDVRTHVRGRNKPIVLGQVGIRCRHCAHLSASRRQKGATYFPASTIGLYQAAQNMCTAHIQCGLCTEMPDPIKDRFKQLIATKSFTSGAGKPYWSKSAKGMGLVDTEEGIFFIRNVPFLK